MSDVTPSPDANGHSEPSRRDFIYIAAGGAVAVGGAFVLWPFIDQMNPAADTLALASIRAPFNDIAEGEQVTVMWRGGPVFIRRRTQADIESARAVELAALPDKDARNENEPGAEATDPNRSALSAPVNEGVEVPEDVRASLIVMKGNCTHLGCVPVGDGAGDYNGWFCPCHGSHYDAAGRIRRGPAPENLHIPPYSFVSSTTIQIG
ncbi:ubiquinol-cytochrome c reductase iron-sulfur subunit [Marinicauda algicola]|uniref:ubiquinol-cytochrome c reductase iron-sulfur subunit n=1 Tax=Marinicauda algicola TaxID=2029849 RepID=UPI001F1452BC|nr:ubiquinol-cytochrome c reductase iron-sulfur subunit [Marinicauda algicola]